MEQLNESNLNVFCKLVQQFNKIQKRVQSEEITPTKREALNKELETIHSNLDKLKQNASNLTHLFSQMEEMEREMVSLYREIEDRFEDYEVTIISREALSLGNCLELGKMVIVAKKVDSLSHNILFLYKHRRPSMSNRRIVNLAMKLVDQARGVLSGEEQEHVQLIHLLKQLLQEAMAKADESAMISEGEAAMELYEIAELFYEKKLNEARFRLKFLQKKLTPTQIKRLEMVADSPEEMIRALLEIADGDPCLEWEKSQKATIHVLQA